MPNGAEHADQLRSDASPAVMAIDQDEQRERHAQVGFLMRAYRESFSEPGRRRGLSQDELLRRMAAVDDSYSRRFSHATVTRWEAGTTRPNVERLRVFGKALNLSESEVSGLMLLAGLAPDLQAADPEAQFSVSDSEPVAVPGADPQMADPPNPAARRAVRNPRRRCGVTRCVSRRFGPFCPRCTRLSWGTA